MIWYRYVFVRICCGERFFIVINENNQKHILTRSRVICPTTTTSRNTFAEGQNGRARWLTTAPPDGGRAERRAHTNIESGRTNARTAKRMGGKKVGAATGRSLGCMPSGRRNSDRTSGRTDKSRDERINIEVKLSNQTERLKGRTTGGAHAATPSSSTIAAQNRHLFALREASTLILSIVLLLKSSLQAMKCRKHARGCSLEVSHPSNGTTLKVKMLSPEEQCELSNKLFLQLDVNLYS